MLQYEVGYKKPPLHSRFTKGKSGNPRGRPKKCALTIMEIFQEELARKITVKEGDKTSKITLERAAIRQLIHAAVKGDMRAFKQLIELRSSAAAIEELITVPQILLCPPDGPRPYPAPSIYGGEDDS